MEHSIFLAKLVGPYCIIVALAFLLNRQNYDLVVEGMLSNAGVRCIGGMIGLLIGLLLVNTHNVWEYSWVVIITLMGWIALIKGITLFVFPNHFIKFAESYTKKKNVVKVQLCLTFVFGLLLTYQGYF